MEFDKEIVGEAVLVCFYEEGTSNLQRICENYNRMDVFDSCFVISSYKKYPPPSKEVFPENFNKL